MNFPEWVDIISPRRYRLLIKMQFWAWETFLQVIVQRGPRGLQNRINYYHMPWLSAMTTWQDPEMQRCSGGRDLWLVGRENGGLYDYISLYVFMKG